jgi:hypothetical protein
MLSKRLITTAFAAAILTTLSAAPADAQGNFNRRTEFTFNQPVEVPGATLPPGTYIFRIMDSTSNRFVMEISAKDSTNKRYGHFLTINARRPKPSEEAELRFLETPAGQPAAVKTWWYPGEYSGREFIYPREQAMKLAKATNQTVLTTQAEDAGSAQKSDADLAYVAPSGQVTPLTDEEMNKLVDTAANTPPVGATEPARAPVQEGTSAANTRTALPKTATPLASVALLGLISLLGAAAVRVKQ